MPISLTAIGTNNGKASTGLAITVPAGGVPQGALIVFCSVSLTNDVTAVSDTNNSGYTQAVSSGGPPRTQTYYFPNCAALVSTNTITPTYAAATTIAMSAFYATGIATVGPLDNTTGVATGSSTTPSATTGTLLVSGELVVGVVAVNGPSGDTFTQLGGFAAPPTRVGTSGGATASNVTLDGGTELAPDTTAVTYNPTLGTSHAWAETIATFKPAAAAGTPWFDMVGYAEQPRSPLQPVPY